MSSDPPPPPSADPPEPSGLDLARTLSRAYRSLTAARPAGRRTRSPNRQVRTSGAGPDDRDPQRLGSEVDRLVAAQGWSSEVAVHAIFGRWDSIVGPEVAQHCHPERYADARLVVRADSTAWATQMRWLSATVRHRLADELGGDTVTEIVVLGPQSPSWRKGRRSVRGRGPRDTYG